MKPCDIIRVRASDILGTQEDKGIVIRVEHEIGDPRYPMGLILVQCLTDPFGIYGHVDFEGYIYSGPPYADGRLPRFV